MRHSERYRAECRGQAQGLLAAAHLIERALGDEPWLPRDTVQRLVRGLEERATTMDARGARRLARRLEE